MMMMMMMMMRIVMMMISVSINHWLFLLYTGVTGGDGRLLQFHRLDTVPTRQEVVQTSL